ncbi:MAG: hypothetical protein D6731_24260 [Planctomycetota bacterium]|nr:MAG: hypothetical protein D6731_24260 [Planctomycetota bacterium]
MTSRAVGLWSLAKRWLGAAAPLLLAFFLFLFGAQPTVAAPGGAGATVAERSPPPARIHPARTAPPPPFLGPRAAPWPHGVPGVPTVPRAEGGAASPGWLGREVLLLLEKPRARCWLVRLR